MLATLMLAAITKLQKGKTKVSMKRNRLDPCI